MEITDAIIEHYEKLFNILCSKSKAFTQKLEELAPSNPDLPEKTLNTDKPIQELKDKLTQKRANKIQNLQTHI